RSTFPTVIGASEFDPDRAHPAISNVQHNAMNRRMGTPLFEALAREHHDLVSGKLNADEAILLPPSATRHAQCPGALTWFPEQFFDFSAGHSSLQLGEVLLRHRAARSQQHNSGE